MENYLTLALRVVPVTCWMSNQNPWIFLSGFKPSTASWYFASACRKCGQERTEEVYMWDFQKGSKCGWADSKKCQHWIVFDYHLSFKSVLEENALDVKICILIKKCHHIIRCSSDVSNAGKVFLTYRGGILAHLHCLHNFHYFPNTHYLSHLSGCHTGRPGRQRRRHQLRTRDQQSSCSCRVGD